MEYVIQLFASFLAVMFVITIHEFAHAFIAYKCGDPTAKYEGRMTLNPVKHFDLMGILFFAFAGFGWAKPVPVNPYNFKNYRWGSFFTAIAGIAINYICAFLFYPLFLLAVQYLMPLFAGKYMEVFIYCLPRYLYGYSITFCIFNLLPFYPLDGFRMWDALDKKNGTVLQFLRMYGSYILMGLIAINFLSQYVPLLGYVNILGIVMDYAGKLLEWPITHFWQWIFTL